MTHQTSEDAEDDEFEYYIVHDSIGVSHVLRKEKGRASDVQVLQLR
jgi:hypothetical protein